MPLTPLNASDERELLTSWLSHGRYLLTVTAFGLTEEQAHSAPTASSLSIAALIAHCGAVERAWMNGFMQRDNDGSERDDPVAAFDRAAEQPMTDIMSDYLAPGSNTDTEPWTPIG